MSRSVPEWFGASDDTPIPARVQLRVIVANNGRCAVCTRKIGAGAPYQIDHVTAVINGGPNRESNLQVLCTECHTKKTGIDVKGKSITYRNLLNHFRINKRPRSKYKRKVDGTVVLR